MINPWFQLVASLIAMIMIANLQYTFTLFLNPIQDAMGWKLPEISGAFSFFILLQTWVQPLDGWLMDRMGPRKFITAAGVLCGVGWSAMGMAASLPQLYFFYGLAGVGAAFVYSGCVGSALKWFPYRRGFAAGIIAAGFGGGATLFNPIIRYLIDVHSYSSAFLVTGIFQGVVIAVVAQFLRHPDANFVAAKPATAVSAKVAARRNNEQFTTGEMLRTPLFYLMYVMFVAIATGGLVATAQAGPLARDWGLGAGALAAATFLSPTANGASRISWGWISDRLGRENTMTVAFFIQAICLVGVLTLGKTSAAWFTVTLVLTFFTWGEIYSLFPAALGDYFGSRNATSNYSVLYTAKGVASILAGVVAALLHDRFGNWDAVFYGSAVLAFLAAIGAVILKAAPLPKKTVAAEHAVVSS